MKFARFNRIVVTAALLATFAAAAQTVDGATGSGSGAGWQAGWLDLKAPQSFKKGDKLTIKVDGSAENVLVRLLPVSGDASTSVGLEGKTRKVPGDRVLTVTLERDHPNVKQISVHGGASAWGTSLGANNGAVTIVSIERVTR